MPRARGVAFAERGPRRHEPRARSQALADLLTLREAFGRLEGLKLAYVGDGNNVARSLTILGPLAGARASTPHDRMPYRIFLAMVG